MPVGLRAASLELWDAASHREERYAAMALLALRPSRGQPELVELIEHMVRTGRWWDYTDELAHRLAELHDVRPVPTASLVRDVGGRRGLLDPPDRDPVAARPRIPPRPAAARRTSSRPNLADPEFFIRKAIGWALREYARVDAGLGARITPQRTTSVRSAGARRSSTSAPETRATARRDQPVRRDYT